VSVDRHDVRAVQSRGGVGFTAEPFLKHRVFGNLGGQDLDRDGSVDDGVVGPPNLAHTATAQQLHQAVARERHPIRLEAFHRFA
jgi:hypothetical protein